MITGRYSNPPRLREGARAVHQAALRDRRDLYAGDADQRRRRSADANRGRGIERPAVMKDVAP
jgi:hypothetical protein